MVITITPDRYDSIMQTLTSKVHDGEKTSLFHSHTWNDVSVSCDSDFASDVEITVKLPYGTKTVYKRIPSIRTCLTCGKTKLWYTRWVDHYAD